jgi:hypothetical protein
MKYVIAVLALSLLLTGCEMPKWPKSQDKQPAIEKPVKPAPVAAPATAPKPKAEVQAPLDNSAAYQAMRNAVGKSVQAYLDARMAQGFRESTARVELVVFTGLYWDFIKTCEELKVQRDRLPYAYEMYCRTYQYREQFAKVFDPLMNYVAKTPGMSDVDAYFVTKSMIAEISRVGAKEGKIDLSALVDAVTKDAVKMTVEVPATPEVKK